MVKKQMEAPPTGSVTVYGIEGHWAKIELPVGKVEDWSLASLPIGVKEGDVVSVLVMRGDLETRINHLEHWTEVRPPRKSAPDASTLSNASLKFTRFTRLAEGEQHAIFMTNALMTMRRKQQAQELDALNLSSPQENINL